MNPSSPIWRKCVLSASIRPPIPTFDGVDVVQMQFKDGIGGTFLTVKEPVTVYRSDFLDDGTSTKRTWFSFAHDVVLNTEHFRSLPFRHTYQLIG